MSEDEHRSLHELVGALKGIEIAWMNLEASSPLVGRTLAEADIRAQSGASVVALVRDQQLIANPKSITVFQAGDRIGVIGEKDQLEAVQQWIGDK
jgi:CPA2 family monovalent cation:H+ antiporter-2